MIWVFLLNLVLVILVSLQKKKTALGFFYLNLLVGLFLLWYHMTDAIDIRL